MHEILSMGGDVGFAWAVCMLAVTMFLVNLIGHSRRERPLRAMVRRSDRPQRVDRE